MKLTDPQKRILMFMDEFGPKWFTLLELNLNKLLEPDDVITVPSLIAHRLIWGLAALQAVALTPDGMTVAEDLRDVEYLARTRKTSA